MTSNSNELFSVNAMQSTLNQLRQDVVNMAARQGNKSTALQQNIEDSKQRVSEVFHSF